MATNLGDITLNDVKYRIDLSSYREKDLADFSPRASVPGGSVNMSELLLYQPLTMTDWRHGYGFLWHTDAMGYMRSYGDIDTRMPGAMMMASNVASVADGTPQTHNFKGFTKFNNKIYGWSGTAAKGLQEYSTIPWTTIYNTAGVHFALSTEEYLFFCGDGQRLQYITKSSSTPVAAGIGATTADILFMVMHNGRIYANPQGTNRLHYGVEATLSDLDTREADDPNHIKVGAGGFPLLGAISYANYLYVFRRDGVFVVGDDDTARRILDFSGDAGSLNFKGYTIYNGYLYFNVGARVYQWNGARLTDVTPPRLGDRYPYSEVRYYGGMETAGNYLYVLGQWYDDEAVTYGVSLFCFDGVGWHKLNDLGTTGTRVVSDCPLFADGENGLLYMDIPTLTGDTKGAARIILPQRDVAPSPFAASLDTDTAPYFKTPRLDMGFRRITKSVPSILVEADNLSTVSTEMRYLSVDYYVDGSTTIESFGNVTANGVTELFPNQQDASPAPTQEFRNMVLMVRFVNAGAATAHTPILEGLTVRFLMRPDVFYGYSFNIVVAENYVYGDEQANISAKDIRDTLLAVRDSKAPVEFIDIYGDTHDVYISSVQLTAVERHENSEDGTNNIESVIQVNVVEVA